MTTLHALAGVTLSQLRTPTLVLPRGERGQEGFGGLVWIFCWVGSKTPTLALEFGFFGKGIEKGMTML